MTPKPRRQRNFLPREFPLAEIFGFPRDNFEETAARYRANRWCPFNNPTGANCTKDSLPDPLGVCSIFYANQPIITCPVRFRQDWRVIEDAARFFFPNRPGDSPLPRMLSEMPIRDGAGKEAGNIDMVLLDLDENGVIRDYGALEIQAVYISGSVRPLFKHFMTQKELYAENWPYAKYPRPDFLSSSRKRLAPQLLYKGTLLNHWKRKIAVAVQKEFFETMPTFKSVEPSKADLAWLIYELSLDAVSQQYELKNSQIVYTNFNEALTTFTVPPLVDENVFLSQLQNRIKTGQTAPDLADAPIILDVDSE